MPVERQRLRRRSGSSTRQARGCVVLTRAGAWVEEELEVERSKANQSGDGCSNVWVKRSVSGSTGKKEERSSSRNCS